MVQMITSLSNPIVKHVKSLHKKKGRWKSKNYFVEGIRAVEESIASNGKIEYVIYSDSLFNVNGGKLLFDIINEKNYTSYYVSDKILKEISDTENPQGIIAVVKFEVKEVMDLLDNNCNLLVLLDRIQDPGNIGTIIRSADAFGATGIIMTKGCVDLYNPKVIRASMGSIFHIPVAYTDIVSKTLKGLKERGLKIVTTSLDTNSYCHEVNLTQDIILVVGNEGSGVSEEIMDFSDYMIKVPIVGKAESLNVGVATGIVLYEAYRQRQNV